MISSSESSGCHASISNKMQNERQTLANILLLLSCVSCAGTLQDAKFAGGDGGSCSSAVEIRGVSDERMGVQAEHAWLGQHYPGHTMNNQALIDCNGKKADRVGITTSDGTKRDVYFDISEFFGKY